MDFRRSGQRDGRRRRVLLEDNAAAGYEEGSAAEALSRGRSDAVAPRASYPEAARAEGQPRITDMIPKRPLTLFVVGLLGLSMIAGVLALYAHIYHAPGIYSNDQLAAFNPESPGSVAAWLGSLLLTIAAAAGLLVFLVRRHKHDDYRGHYRWWLWNATVLQFASVDVACGLHRLIPPPLIRWTGEILYEDGTVWWILVLGAVGLAIITRVAIEIRQSFAASVMLFLAVAGYVTGALLRLDLLTVGQPNIHVMVKCAVVLSAHLAVALSVLSFARYVYQDAQGRIVKRGPESRVQGRMERRPEPSGASEPEMTTADNQETPDNRESKRAERRKSLERKDPAPTIRAEVEGDHDDAPSGNEKKKTRVDEEHSAGDQSERPISKAERRRLRKQKRRERAAAPH